MTTTTFGILTISDSCFDGRRIDTSGPELQRLINNSGLRAEKLVNGRVECVAIVPDNELLIMETLVKWSDEMKLNVILTSGGTGFSLQDVTPEATKKVIHREAPGISHLMLSESLKSTPMAVLSRAVCGIRNQSLIINLPGSPKAVRECFNAIVDVIPHAVDIMLNTEVDGFHTDLQQGVERAYSHGKSGFDPVNLTNRHRKSPYPMVSFEESQRILKKSITSEDATVRVNIWDCFGRILAERVVSNCHLPPFRASVKDGYAVIADDGKGSRKVLGSSEAGCEPGHMEITTGTCIRINTGAPVPDGATAVVQVEDTRLSRVKEEEDEEDEIEILVEPEEGQDIRPVGSDIEEGAPVLNIGTKIGFVEMGILAACARSDIVVTEIPKVGVLSTGNELQDVGETAKPGHIYDSNKISLIVLFKENGFNAIDLGIAIDQETSIILAIEKALEKVDVIITTGSVSMGDRDLLKPILMGVFGAEIQFGRVNMKPGKPTTFATINHDGKKKYFLCLPGNPVSAIVTAQLFAIPLLNFITRNDEEPIVVKVQVMSRYILDSRPEFARVVLNWSENSPHPKAFSTGNQSSSRLLSCKSANALLMLPARTDKEHEILEGTLVPAMLFGLSQKSI